MSDSDDLSDYSDEEGSILSVLPAAEDELDRQIIDFNRNEDDDDSSSPNGSSADDNDQNHSDVEDDELPPPPPDLTPSDLERFYNGSLVCLRVHSGPLISEHRDLDPLMDTAFAAVPDLLAELRGNAGYMTRLRKRHREVLLKPCSCLVVLLGLGPQFFRAVHATMHSSRRRRGKVSMSEQNDMLEKYVFDAYGNTLYHGLCAQAVFNISSNRLKRRREFIRLKYLQLNLEYLFKHSVRATRLRDVVVPENVRALEWWGSLRDTVLIALRMNARHGLCNQPSNNAYSNEECESFLNWCEVNSMPTGRKDRWNPTRYFSSVFARIGRYKTAELEVDPQRWRWSVIAQYRECCRERHAAQGTNRRIPSEATLCKWLKEKTLERYSIQPHQSDYCDTCARFRVELEQMQGVRWAHSKVSGNVTEHEHQLLDARRREVQRRWNDHRAQGRAEHDAYIASIQEAAVQWTALQAHPEEERRDGHAVICVDYMQERTLPFFGDSPQPGETYYKQKLTVHLFGLVQHHLRGSLVYLSDERAGGAKSSDHICSYLTHYVSTLPAWVRTITIWGDNAGTIKSRYLVAWAADLVARAGHLRTVHLRFMLPGHTKFSPDTLFASISATYRKSDVLSMEDLERVVSYHATSTTFNYNDICLYREYFATRYTAFRGIRPIRWIEVSLDDTAQVHVRTSATNTTAPTREHRIVRADPAPFQESPPGYTTASELDPRKVADLRYVYSKYAPDKTPAWLAGPSPVVPEGTSVHVED